MASFAATDYEYTSDRCTRKGISPSEPCARCCCAYDPCLIGYNQRVLLPPLLHIGLLDEQRKPHRQSRACFPTACTTRAGPDISRASTTTMADSNGNIINVMKGLTKFSGTDLMLFED